MYHDVMVAPITSILDIKEKLALGSNLEFWRSGIALFLECLECRILICLLQIGQYQVKIHHVTLNS